MNFANVLRTPFQQNTSRDCFWTMYLLKFETKIVQFKATSFSLQFELLTNLCKREMFKLRKTSFDQSIAKFFMFSWPNFTIVKYTSKISIICHQIKISRRYNEHVFNKKAALKIRNIHRKTPAFGSLFK